MAYKGRVLDCLSDPARRFFKDEFKKDSDDASLRRLEYLIIDIVRPYKIGTFFFLACTILLSAYTAYNAVAIAKVKDEQTAMAAERKKTREVMDELEKKVITLSKGLPSNARETTAGMEQLAENDLASFFEELKVKAEGDLITKEEVARLLKVAGSKDAAFTLRQVQARKKYSEALSQADMAWLSAKASGR